MKGQKRYGRKVWRMRTSTEAIVILALLLPGIGSCGSPTKAVPTHVRLQEERARLSSKDRIERGNAANALGNMGELAMPAVEALMAACDDEDLFVRWAAYDALGKMRDRRALDPLVAALEDNRNEKNNRCAAIGALGKLGDVRAVTPLLCHAGEFPGGVEEVACLMAVRSLGVEAVEPLVEAAKDDDEKVRAHAVQVLGMIGETLDRPQAVEPLAEAAKDDDEGVRAHAVRALGIIGETCDEPQVVPVLIQALADGSEHVRGVAASYLGRIKSPAAVDRLITALDDPSWSVRQDACFALGAIGDVRTIGPLMAALKDEAWRVRCAAASSLGAFREPRAVEALVAAIDDKTERTVVEALGKIGDSRGFEPVLQALGDDRMDIRVAAAEALGKLADERGVKPLEALLEKERDTRLRITIMLALSRIEGRPDRAALAAAIEDEDDEVRYLASQTLVNRQDATLDDIATALTSEDRRVRYSAVGKLADLNDSRAVELLIRTLRDPDDRVRRVAVRALARLGDARAVEPLIAVLKEEADEGFRYEDIRDVVAEALRELTGRNFGHLHTEWSAWWRQHKRSFT